MKSGPLHNSQHKSVNGRTVVAIDARKYFDYGIGTYIQNLIEGLGRLKSSYDFLAYVAVEDDPRVSVPGTWRKSVVDYPKYSIQETFLFSAKSKKDRVNVFHSPHYTLPYGLKMPSIVTIHDLIPLRFPEYFNALQRTYARAMMSHAISRSRCVLVDSEFTKRDISSFFRVNENKIVVAHLGVGPEFKNVSSSQKLESFRERFFLKNPFILFVGNTKPHKGLHHLLSAFALLKPRDLDLAIIGGSLSQDAALGAAVRGLGLSGKVKELGRVNNEDLVLAYNAAEALVLPSLYEGFGLPAIEAMACKTPVVVSDGGALREIVDDAAIIVERGNINQLHDALQQVLKDSRLRSSLVAKGGKNAKRFLWSKTAKKVLSAYESALK